MPVTAPSGFCQCGCGQLAPLAKGTDHRFGLVKGQPCHFIAGHAVLRADRKKGGRGYMAVVRADGSSYKKGGRRYQLEHIAIVERLLGHSLPPKAQVHHVDGNRGNNANHNLVACQDTAYHRLLHVRARALAACRNPNYRKCTYCQTWDDVANLTIYSGCRKIVHAECSRREALARFHRNKAEGRSQ